MNIDPNRPAFPSTKDTPEWREGIGIRDYYASKAMQGYISDREMYMAMMMDLRTSGLTPDEHIANESYNLADAMLKRRQK
jgi:hypothetical protein